jgi:hypothetical protein
MVRVPISLQGTFGSWTETDETTIAKVEALNDEILSELRNARSVDEKIELNSALIDIEWLRQEIFLALSE